MEDFPRHNQETVRVRLPDSKELESRMLALFDDRTVVKDLYPHILRHAGETVSLAEVADIVLKAMEGYANTFPFMSGLVGTMLPQLAETVAANPAAAEVLRVKFLQEIKFKNSSGSPYAE
jgi:hypothetical protein